MSLNKSRTLKCTECVITWCIVCDSRYKVQVWWSHTRRLTESQLTKEIVTVLLFLYRRK